MATFIICTQSFTNQNTNLIIPQNQKTGNSFLKNILNFILVKEYLYVCLEYVFDLFIFAVFSFFNITTHKV